MLGQVRYLIAVIVLVAPTAWPQAAAEYGTVTSGSAAGAARLGSSIGQMSKRVSGRLQTKTSKSVQEISPAEGQGQSLQTLDTVMRANRQKLESDIRANGATLQIASVPNTTMVLIDGAAVAYGSVDIRLPAAGYVVELRHPGFRPWRQQVSVTTGETLHLEPKLERAKNVVIVSFDK